MAIPPDGNRELYGRPIDDEPRRSLWQRIFGGKDGGHWKAPQASHGGAPDGASAGNNGTSYAALARTVDTSWADYLAVARACHPGAGAGASQPVTATAAAQAQALHQQQMDKQPMQQYVAMFVQPSQPDPEPENAGITVGEIIAWRSWKVKNGLLTSMYADQHVWAPHEPITGNPSQKGAHHPVGVHAFKSEKAALEYAMPYRTRELTYNQHSMQTRVREVVPVVIGRVALWGEVIEHEKGYRAEYAKVHSLDVPLGISAEELDRLRALYLRPQPDSAEEG